MLSDIKIYIKTRHPYSTLGVILLQHQGLSLGAARTICALAVETKAVATACKIDSAESNWKSRVKCMD